MFKVGDSAETVNAGDVLADGWNDFVNGATYEIASGKYITVAQINVASYTATGSGNAVVVSAA